MPATRLRYGPDPDQHGILLPPAIPRAQGPFPVAVLVHGGGWHARYGTELMSALAGDLAQRGWVAWNLEFRRVGSGGGWPVTGDDVLAGIDALAGVDAPVDLDRVVLIGHSSGGQLALWAAAQRAGGQARVRVRAVVALAAVTDLAAHDSSVVADFLGAVPREAPEAYASASPAEQLPLGVPQLLLHGEADATVPAQMTRDYARRAGAAGDDVTVVVRPGDGHMAPVDPAGAGWAAVVRWLEPWGP